MFDASLSFLLLLPFVTAEPVRRGVNAYAPVSTACPTTSLVRQATGLSSSEASYVQSRQSIASEALTSWFDSTGVQFDVSSSPSVALAVSGGSYRSLLVGAGVIQAFDARDSDAGTSGLYQGLMYQTGLSGGSWLLSSLAGNNWPTVSSLTTNLWKPAFSDTLFFPQRLLALRAYVKIIKDITAKDDAGFSPTVTDPWGRLLSYQLLYGDDGGVSTTLSSISGLSNFSSFAVPFPIMTAMGIEAWDDKCIPGMNGTQYEFTPYEFGSWDNGVEAFAKTEYLGTSMSNGSPSDDLCVSNYDNLGYVFGTSSNVFNQACLDLLDSDSDTAVESLLAKILKTFHETVFRDEFAVYPNPFYKYDTASLVSAHKELYLGDGAESLQNNPIWPLIQTARDVDVIIVNDNTADTSDNYPNGTEIQLTYVEAQKVGLTKMPYIPSAEVFISEGLNKRPTFFGCNDTNTTTIVYLPNQDYTYDTGISTLDIDFDEDETEAIIENGMAVATMNGNSTWPTCFACAIVMKTGDTLPDACTDCFATFCYYE